MSQQIEFLQNGKSAEVGVKRRIRTLKSCLSCRKRRKKCDKARPSCGTCVLKGQAHLCEYEDNRWSVKISDLEQHASANTASGLDPKESSSNATLPRSQYFINEIVSGVKTEVVMEPTSPNNERIYSQVIISDPLSLDQNEIINFCDFPLPKTNAFDRYGTLSWTALSRKDIYVNAVFSSENPESASISLRNENSDASDSIKFFEKWELDHPELFNKCLLKRNKLTYQDEAEFIDHVKIPLRNAKLCWVLVEIFWETELVVKFPLAGKAEFTGRLSKILTESGKINIETTRDLSTVGVLLMIMKITDFFINYNYGKETTSLGDPRIEFIHKNPMKTNIVDIISKINTEITSLKPCSIESFQFLLFREYYNMVAPEESSCINLHSDQIGFLLDYANQCSLNRDPERVLGIKDEKKIAMLRRLWYSLVLMDFYQHLLLGTSRVIHEDLYDTLLPEEAESNGNGCLQAQHLGKTIAYLKSFDLLLKMVTSIKHPPTMGQLDIEISKIKTHLNQFKSFEELKKANSVSESVDNIFIFNHSMNGHLLLFMVYYHLYIHYSRSHNKSLAVLYLVELLKTSMVLFQSISFVCPSLHPEKDPRAYFGSGLFIFPSIENALHKFTIFLISMLGRIKLYKLSLFEELPLPITSLIDKITSLIYKTLDNMMANFAIISDTYFHAWMSTKIHSIIIQKCLFIPMGTTYNASKTLTDLNMVGKLNQFKGVEYDPGFSWFDESDLSILCHYFEEIYDLSVLNGKFTGTIINEEKLKHGIMLDVPQVDSLNLPVYTHINNLEYDSVSTADKRWLEKVVNDSSGEIFTSQGYDHPSISNLANTFFSAIASGSGRIQDPKKMYRPTNDEQEWNFIDGKPYSGGTALF